MSEELKIELAIERAILPLDAMLRMAIKDIFTLQDQVRVLEDKVVALENKTVPISPFFDRPGGWQSFLESEENPGLAFLQSLAPDEPDPCK